MKATCIALALACAATSFAQAQSFDGATIEINRQDYDDGNGFSVEQFEVYGDLAFSFGDFGVQLGLAYAEERGSSDPNLDFMDYNGIAAHLFYDVNEMWRIGLMLSDDSFDDADYGIALEAIYLNGPVRLEGRVGSYVAPDDPDIGLYSLYGT